MRAAVIVVLVVLVAVGGVSVWRSHTAGTTKVSLYVAVPQGLFLPFSKVVDKYQAEHPNVDFPLLVDTPEAMAQAVEENKDKPDIFISPGGHEIEVLREKGLVDPETEVAFGSYDLAILVPKDNPGKVSKLEDLLNPEVKVISISDPDLNAACYAARQSLQNLGLWEKLKPKMKVTGCCMSSFRWILDGRAEANVQFLGCPLDPKTADTAEKTKVKFACSFPKETFYVPRNVAGLVTKTKKTGLLGGVSDWFLRNVGGVVTPTRKRQMASDFLRYLTSPETIRFMTENRMRNDRNLPHTPGPWGPAQEASPMEAKQASK